MQSTFKTLDVKENSFEINERKLIGDRVEKIENVKVIVSLLI